MILRRLSLSHWRAHAALDLRFADGLNVVVGRNEAGKSSLVEALDWALFRDVTGGAGRLKTDEIKCIIPATDPAAKPRVEAEIEFANCSATVSKVVCEDAGKRECRLCVRVPGQPDEWFERTEAQAKLRDLFAADGLGAARGVTPESALLVAHQGEGVEFVLDGGAAMRSTLGMGDEGDLALTNRLERVRQLLERERKRDLMLELAPRALDGAKAGTDAARARDEWKSAVAERARFEAMSGEIEVIRAELEELRGQSDALKAAGDEAAARQDSLGDRLNAQYEADKTLADAELERREAVAARDDLARRVKEIGQLETERGAAQAELDSLSDSLATLDADIGAARAACEAGTAARDHAETGARTARETLARWRAVWEVFESDRHLKAENASVALLESLGEEVAAAQAELDGAPPAPDEAELRALRRDFETLEALEREANRGLQIALEAHATLRVSFKADKDNDTAQSLRMAEGERQLLNARAQGALDIEGVGRLRIKSGARGVEELSAELEEKRADLGARLLRWNVALDETPTRLDDLDEARAERERARRILSEARRRLEDEEAKAGQLTRARERLADAHTEFDARRDEARRFEGALKFSGLRRPQVREKLSEAEELESDAQSLATRARNAWDKAAHELRVLEANWNAASNRPGQLRQTIEDRAARLLVLRADGTDDEERLTRLRQAQERAIKAEMRASDANAQRGGYGNSLDKFKVEAARREAVRLAEERSLVETKLAERRRDLFHLCEQDPETRRDALDAQIERLEPLVTEHEARLRGLALVCAAMEVLRAQLGRDLGGPLNARLGPWLSKLRGKETALVFSDDGAKLLRVRTQHDGATIELPFAQHSEGMKEQVAFALRLLLAQRVVNRLPSKRGCVVLDDPFTQSDSGRRQGLSAVLSDALESLQIVFVTCHPAPVLDGRAVNIITLGEWNEPEAPTERAPIQSQVVRDETGTLALF